MEIVKITRGLDIQIEGKASFVKSRILPHAIIEVKPDNYHGITPKMFVKGGEIVKVGSPLFYSKEHPEMNFVSPVSGNVVAVVRGERRKVLNITIETDTKQAPLSFNIPKLDTLTRESIKNLILQSGLWAYIKQRPFDIIANPNKIPKNIFISCFDSAPLAPDYEFIMKDRMSDFQAGVDVMRMLTPGKIYLGIKAEESIFTSIEGVEFTIFKGKHPSGNVGVQINHTAPVNRGEVVWTINPQDVAIIGKFFATGIIDFTKMIAITGPEVINPQYFETIAGNSIRELITNHIKKVDYPLRFISGNVLTGTKISSEGYLTPYDSQITVIDEGSETHEMFGWAMPRLNRFSASHTFFTRLFPRKTYKYDARLMGGRRAIIMSGEWDNVFPMDILPEFLIKAMIAGNVEKMENLGAYEVAPEDFALCEFVDTSKMPLQAIVREALDNLKQQVE